MIKAVIFDLDGTLLDTLEGLKTSTNFALAQLNYPEKSMDEIRSYVGNGVKKLIERAIPNGLDNNDFEECLRIFKAHYSQNMQLNTHPYNGIQQILIELKNRNIKIGVVSNKFDSAVKKLCEKYFPNQIDIAIGESRTIKPKPCPDGLIKAMQNLNVTKEKTLYIGDSEVDILTAKNADIRVIGVTWGFRDKKTLIDSGAEHLIDFPKDILKFL